MAGILSIKVEQKPDGFFATLSGDITEESNFSAITDLKPSKVTLNLSEITRINSTGVREWINFVSALQKAGTRIVLEQCSVAIVQQLNMISNFRGGGQVTSVYSPYFCESCEAEHTRLLTLAPGKKPDLNEPFNCPTCQSLMEFDDLPETYLSFMDV